VSEAPVVDEELAAFLQSGQSLHVASRGESLAPSLDRALGCRVSDDRRRVTVFILASHGARMVEDFGRNGAIAFVASQPSTHRTVQLKGVDATVGPAGPGDAALLARQADGFARDLVTLGYDESLPRLLVEGDLGDVVAVSFTPVQAFVQTPGPGAGAPLGARLK
jgi:hypothetical protein